MTLDKEGSIHDFAWSPNLASSKDVSRVSQKKNFSRTDVFVPRYDMPAKTMLFDQRVRTLHDFGASPHNFNSQGRLIALARFGNLVRKLEIMRGTLGKVCTITH